MIDIAYVAAAYAVAMFDAPAAPVDVPSSAIALPPSPAVRAATVVDAGAIVAEPKTFRILCSVQVATGTPQLCLLENAGTSWADWGNFNRAAHDFAASLFEPDADPALRAAYERVTVTRLHPQKAEASQDRRLLRFTETVAATDILSLPAARGQIDRTELEITFPGDTGESLYPVRALRNNEEARVTMTCRVKADLGLACRDGVASLADDPSRTPAAQALSERLFVVASYQLASLARVAPLSPSRDIVGFDVSYPVFWALPR